MGILNARDIPDMITGSINYLRAVRQRELDFVVELVVLAVAQYLYAVYCTRIENDKDHVKSTLKSVCENLPNKYRKAAGHVIATRNLVAHYIGTTECTEALSDIQDDLQLILEIIC